MSRHLVLLSLSLVLLTTAACSRDDRRSAPPARAQASPPALVRAAPEDLRKELEDAMRLGTWREVRTRWQGQRLAWKVTRYRSLCATADACNVAAFPVQRPARQGWMPAVSFASGQFEALSATCGDREPCELTIDATLVELDATGERATKIRFDDVKVVRGT
jgi:hypothetical protein